MRVLIACEYSGTVRDTFRFNGHDAWSCDLLPSDGVCKTHIQDNVLRHLDGRWDLLIAHPPCTFLTVAANRWKKINHYDQYPDREEQVENAVKFFFDIAYASIPRICIENPVGIMSSRYRKPDQIIQPFEYGHPESKATCLWLKGLPLLVPTDVLPLPPCGYWENQTPSRQNKLTPGATRSRERARTYQGVANAMMNQWGQL